MSKSRSRNDLGPRTKARLALLVLAWATTAHADKLTGPIIPDEAKEPIAPGSAELPAPYEAWLGAGFTLAPSAPDRDLPPPLARPRELPRRPYELAVSLNAALPSCQPGNIDDSGCATVDNGLGLDAALLYRVSPFFGVGGELTLASFSRAGKSALSSSAGEAKFLGVLGRVYFADSGLWDPYVSLTLGVGSLEARSHSSQLSEATAGFGGRIGGGVDFLLGSRLRVGAAAGFAHWFAWSEERCEAGVCQNGALAYGRLLGFATVGLRVTGSFGDVL